MASWSWSGLVGEEELRDEGRMRSRFKAFKGTEREDENYRKRLEWWVGVVLKTAEVRGVVALETDEVLGQWFKWNGVRPLGMPTVLGEMMSRGDLLPAEGLLRAASPGTDGWAQWGFKQVSWVMGAAVALLRWGRSATAAAPAGTLVAARRLRVLADETERGLLQDSPPAGVLSMREVEGVVASPGVADAQLVVGFLCQEGRARVVSTKQGLGVQLLGAQQGAGGVVEARGVLDMKLAAEELAARVERIEGEMDESTERARTALRAGRRPEAKRHLITRRMLEKAHGDAMTAMSNLEGVLLQVQMAEGTKQTLAALQAGSTVLRQVNEGILEDGHLAEIEEAREDAAQLASHIQQGMEVPGEADTLEEEYARLLAADGDDTVDEMNALPRPPSHLPAQRQPQSAFHGYSGSRVPQLS